MGSGTPKTKHKKELRTVIRCIVSHFSSNSPTFVNNSTSTSNTNNKIAGVSSIFTDLEASAVTDIDPKSENYIADIKAEMNFTDESTG